MIPLASWIILGLNRVDHQSAVNEVIYDNKIAVMALIETQVVANKARFTSSSIKSNWKWFLDYTYAPSKRTQIGQDVLFVDVNVLGVHEQIRHYRIHDKQEQLFVLVSFVYGANEVVEWRVLGDELITFSATHE